MTMRRTLLLLAAALPLLFALELASGPANIELVAAFADWFAGRATSDSIILSEVRVPRALLALCVGASLALSGAALQGLLRNPLASPDILGVSQAAGLCAVLVLYYGLSQRAWFVLPLAALTGALLAVMLMPAVRSARWPVPSSHSR
jgi:iron complex transport system permease protein